MKAEAGPRFANRNKRGGSAPLKRPAAAFTPREYLIHIEGTPAFAFNVAQILPG